MIVVSLADAVATIGPASTQDTTTAIRGTIRRGWRSTDKLVSLPSLAGSVPEPCRLYSRNHRTANARTDAQLTLGRRNRRSGDAGQLRRERRVLPDRPHVDRDHLVLRAGRVDVGRLPDQQVGPRLREVEGGEHVTG